MTVESKFICLYHCQSPVRSTIGMHPCLENPMNNMVRQKDMTLKAGLPRSAGAQYATREEWRNNSRKFEEMEPLWKQHSVVDVAGDGSKVRCCKEQHCIGTWNVRSMNQGKLEVVKQKRARMKTAPTLPGDHSLSAAWSETVRRLISA